MPPTTCRALIGDDQSGGRLRPSMVTIGGSAYRYARALELAGLKSRMAPENIAAFGRFRCARQGSCRDFVDCSLAENPLVAICEGLARAAALAAFSMMLAFVHQVLPPTRRTRSTSQEFAAR
jgi:hypothetical protein